MIRKILLPILLVIFYQSHAQERTTSATSAPEAQPFSLADNNLGALSNSINLFTGEVNLPINLVSLSNGNGLGIDVSIAYSSSGVKQNVETWNLEAPTGILGLGWNLTTPKIVVDNKQTGSKEDDEYYLVEGGVSNKFVRTGHVSQLDISGNDIGYHVYKSQNFKLWKIYYYELDERWEVVKEDETKYIYGGISQHSTAVQYAIKWKNWIGSSSQSSNQSTQAIVWDLAKIENRWQDGIVFTYEQTTEKVGTGPIHYTKASYLKKITEHSIRIYRPGIINNVIGREVEFFYDYKCFYGDYYCNYQDINEYIDPHQEKFEPDAYQERYETKFLDRIEVRNENYKLLNSIFFEYDFLGESNFAKRLLTSIKQINADSEDISPIEFKYLLTGNKKGALEKVTTSSGTEIKYVYSEGETIPTLGGTLNIYADPGFAEPRVWIEDDYVVVSWRKLNGGHNSNNQQVKLEVYQWAGRWFSQQLNSFNADLIGGYQNFELVTEKNFFAVVPKGVSSNSSPKVVYLYSKNAKQIGKWHEYSRILPSSANKNVKLISGERFVGTIEGDGKVTTFVNNGNSWLIDNPNFISGTYRKHNINAINNYIVASNTQYSGGTNYTYKYTLKDDNTWHSYIIDGSKDKATNDERNRWVLGNSCAAYIRAIDTTFLYTWQGSEFVQDYILTPPYVNGSFATILNNNTVYISSGNSSNTDGKTSVARFDGNIWNKLQNLDANSYSNFSFGNDFFLRKTDDLENVSRTFNPNNVSSPWSSDQPAFTSGIVDGFIMGQNMYANGGGVYYRNPNGNWSNTSIKGSYNLLYFSKENAAVIRDVGLGKFVIQEKYPTGFVFNKFHNGLSLKEPALEEDDTYFLNEPNSSSTVKDKSELVGNNIIVLHTETVDDFENATDLHFHFINDHKIFSDPTVYPVKRIEISDQVNPTRITAFKYESGTTDVVGTNGQFGKVTIVPGVNDGNAAIKPFGYTEHYFHNSLSTSVDYGFLTGVQYKNLIYNNSGSLKASAETVWEGLNVDIHRDEDNTKVGTAYFVRPLRKIDIVDGIETTTTYTYISFSAFEPTYQIKKVQVNSVKPDGTPRNISTEYKYWWEAYDSDRSENLFSPVIQTTRKVNTTTTDVTVTTWKDWDTLPIYIKYEPWKSYVWKGTGSPIFSSWTNSTPSNDWLQTLEIISVDDKGKIRETKDVKGIYNRVTYDANTYLPLSSSSFIKSGTQFVDHFTTEYTYDTDYRTLLSEKDLTKGTTVNYLYDNFQRPVATINANGVPISTSTFYDSKKWNEGNYVNSDPHIVHQTIVRGTDGFYDDFTDDSRNWVEVEQNNGAEASWIIQAGKLISSSTGGGSGFWDIYKIDLEKQYTGRVGLEFDLKVDGNASSLSFGVVMADHNWNHTNSSGSVVWTYFNKQTWHRINDTYHEPAIKTLEADKTYRLKILVDIDNHIASYFINGKLFATDKPLYGSGVKQVAFLNYGRGFDTSWEVDNLVIYTDPLQSSTFLDAEGKVMQTITEESPTEVIISETFYDALGRGTVQTKPTKITGSLVYNGGSASDFASFDWNTMALTGVVKTLNDDGDYAYSRTVLEASPLSRPIESGLPGNDLRIGSNHTPSVSFGNTDSYIPTSNTILGLPSGHFYTQRTIDPDGANAYTVTDREGRVIYDLAHLSTTAQTIEYAKTQYLYDDFGNLTTIRPPNYFNPPSGSTNNNFITQMNYDHFGRVTQLTTPDEGATFYTYDEIGRLQYVEDAKGGSEGHDLYFEYDSWGRVTEEGYRFTNMAASYVLSGTYSSTYEEVADVITSSGTVIIEEGANVTVAANQTITLSAGLTTQPRSVFIATVLDEDKVWRKKYSYASATDPQPNQRGQLVKVEVNNDIDVSAEVTETYTYDILGDVTATTISTPDYESSGTTVAYKYDNLGQATSLTYPTIGDIVYSYDVAGRIAAIGTNSNVDAFAAYSYNINGALGKEKLKDNGLTRTFGYNSPGWLTQINDSFFQENIDYTTGSYKDINTGYYSGLIARTRYQLKWSNAPTPSQYNEQFDYDKLGRLKVADNTAIHSADLGVGAGKEIKYDHNGNITQLNLGSTSKTYQYYTGTNRIKNTDGAGNDYEYDHNGNISNSVSKDLNLTYDPFFNLTTRVSRVSSGWKLKMEYGAAHQRVLKRDYDNIGALKNSTYYVHGLGSYPLVEKEKDQTGNEVFRYHIYGPTGLVATQSDGVWYYMLKDHLGSVRVVINNTSTTTTPISYYNYQPFGNVIGSLSLTGNDYPYRYTGQEYDEETELHNYRARLYDSDLGKFYAADPAGQNHSPFSYVGNNPINFVDPSGEVGFFYALAQAAFVGGLSSAHNAYMAGGNPWQAGFQGALQGGLSAGLNQAIGGFVNNNFTAPTSSGAMARAISSPIGSTLTNVGINGLASFASGGSFQLGQGLASSFFQTSTNYINASITFSRNPYILLPDVVTSSPDRLSDIPEWWSKTDLFLNPIRMAMWQNSIAFWSHPVTNGVVELATTIVPVTKIGLLGKAGRLVTGFNKHHVIPNAVYKKFGNQLNNVGWVQNHGLNLKKLPTPFHGNHPAYNKYVTSRINGLINSGQFNMNSMKQLQHQLRQEINSIYLNGNFQRLNHYYKSIGY